MSQLPLIFGRNAIAGSTIGGIKETQECIDFCSKHKVIPEYKTVTYDKLPEVYKNLSGKNDSITRFVLDIAKSKKM